MKPDDTDRLWADVSNLLGALELAQAERDELRERVADCGVHDFAVGPSHAICNRCLRVVQLVVTPAVPVDGEEPTP